MWEMAKIMLGVIGIMIIVELFELPEMIGRKLRGKSDKHDDLQKKISELEKRIKDLENK